jgi:hypothetical protein
MMKQLLALPLVLLLLAGCSEQDPPATAQQGTPPQEGAPATQGPQPTEMAVGTPISAVAKQPPAAASADGAEEIEWDSLIPDDYRPDKILEKYDIDNLADDDPRAAELQKELQALWDQAPVRPELDQRRVKLPGFVVPVETDAEESTGFLLVPYYGACIHVPPPPANQTVYVVTEKGKGTRPKVFDVVWVTGDLTVQRIANDIAEAGYTIYASNVEPYE